VQQTRGETEFTGAYIFESCLLSPSSCSSSTVDISGLTNAQRNLLIWEQAEKPDYHVGLADFLDISRKQQDLSTVLVSAQFLQHT